MSLRAGVVVTGTEVLTGIISDLNGPWLSERLREHGAELGHIVVVGDRRDDLLSALEFLSSREADLIVTTGGLGPTADDLTAEVVGTFTGRPMVLDEALERRIWAILERLARGRRGVDERAMRAGNRKQAVIPQGATILEPVGTAPGLVVPGTEGRPVVVVLPGPPRELRPMWEEATRIPVLSRLLAAGGALERRILRLYGIPESELARSLVELEEGGVELRALEITTCLRRGEIEIATMFRPEAAAAYATFETAIVARHGELVFSADGSTIDDQVAGLLTGRTIATAESCTGGLLAARLTDRAGSSSYLVGGVVAYANRAKRQLAGVPAELIERHGAVSVEVARALADGALERVGADFGVGITGIAGPGGGSAAKPVGTVCFSVAAADGRRLDRASLLPGDRAMVRERSTTLAMHLIRRLLQGYDDLPGR